MQLGRHRKAGFGLLEVMFATAIFIVVVGSLVSLMRLSIRNATLSTHRSQAVNLAQDALEAVRQMRDTTWIRPNGTSDPKDWLSYHNCNPDISNDGLTAIEVGPTYKICFDPNFVQFGILPVPQLELTSDTDSATDPDFFIKLVSTDDKLDPGAPLFYRRSVTFEAVPDTNPATCPVDASSTETIPAGSGDITYYGLQLLGVNSEGKICTLPGVESGHFIKVNSTVAWKDFDKDWQVSLSTILSNWRAQ